MALDQGQVLECGTHDQLMEKNGLYYRWVTSQEREQKNREGETNGEVCSTPKWCSAHISIVMKENEETEDRSFCLLQTRRVIRRRRSEQSDDCHASGRSSRSHRWHHRSTLPTDQQCGLCPQWRSIDDAHAKNGVCFDVATRDRLVRPRRESTRFTAVSQLASDTANLKGGGKKKRSDGERDDREEEFIRRYEENSRPFVRSRSHLMKLSISDWTSFDDWISLSIPRHWFCPFGDLLHSFSDLRL